MGGDRQHGKGVTWEGIDNMVKGGYGRESDNMVKAGHWRG